MLMPRTSYPLAGHAAPPHPTPPRPPFCPHRCCGHGGCVLAGAVPWRSSRHWPCCWRTVNAGLPVSACTALLQPVAALCQPPLPALLPAPKVRALAYHNTCTVTLAHLHRYLTPAMDKHMGLRDTCGVHK